MNINIESYKIHWRGRFFYREVTGQEGKKFNEEFYALAWKPPKFEDRTRYLGIAIYESISQRLQGNYPQDNWIFKNPKKNSLEYYLGKLILKKYQRKSIKRTRDIESAIIYFHYNYIDILDANKKSTKSYRGRNLRIRHTGSVPPQFKDFQVMDGKWRILRKGK